MGKTRSTEEDGGKRDILCAAYICVREVIRRLLIENHPELLCIASVKRLDCFLNERRVSY